MTKVIVLLVLIFFVFAIFGGIAYGLFYGFSHRPRYEDFYRNVELHRFQDKGLEIIDVDEFNVQFSKGTRLGGAGGQGAAFIVLNDPEQFLRMHTGTIYRVAESGDRGHYTLVSYWAYTKDGTLITTSFRQETPGNCSMEKFEKYSVLLLCTVRKD